MKTRLALIFAVLLVLLSSSVSAKEQWTTVRTENFHLIGNADAEQIAAVATKLEQFRQVFSLLFPSIKLTETVETKVIVFKDRATFRPFLPKKQDGKPDDGIGGYFLTAESANFIALSTDLGKKTTFETIFHEYVHYLLNNNFGRSDIPPWLNEGLAEYYSTFEVENNETVYLGNIRRDHLYFLKRNELIPLKTFFSVDNYSLHENGDHSRTVFYAQAWALIHYLAANRKLDRLDLLIRTANSKEDPEKAFENAFGHNYKTMESVLREYVRRQNFPRLVANLEDRLNLNTKVQISVLDDADAFANLGSLLFHRGDLKDAEDYLSRSLTLKKDQSLANTAMGLLKLRQDKFEEARVFLERAVSSEGRDYYVYYSHAYVLSRSNMDDNGFVLGYEPGLALKMRRSIMKAIELRPSFVPSYNLLAFINLATGKNLDEAVGYLRKVLSLQPGNETASLTLAQVYLKQNKLERAKKIAAEIYNSTPDKHQRETAAMVLENIRNVKKIDEQNEKLAEARRDAGGEDYAFAIVRNDLSEKEIARIQSEREISVMNNSILKPGKGEKRIVGYIRSTECDGNNITYDVETVDGKKASLKSVGFRGIRLLAITADAADLMFDCNSNFKRIRAVLNYLPGGRATDGVLQSVSFVPEKFRLKSRDEIEEDTRVMIIKNSERDEGTLIEIKDPPPNETPGQIQERHKRNRIKTIEASLRKPKPGQKRVMGRISRIVCESKEMAFHIITKGETKVFFTNDPQGMSTTVFGQDPKSIQIGCGYDPPDSRVVLTYDSGNSRAGSTGRVLSLEFVPAGVRMN